MENNQSDSQQQKSLKILVTSFQTNYISNRLKELGYEVRQVQHIDGESMSQELLEYKPDILVVRPNRYTKDNIDAHPHIKLVIKAGAGYEALDHAYAAKKGIICSFTPGQNSCDTAELAWGLLCACNRRIVQGSNDLKEGKWDRTPFGSCTGLQNKTLGLIGFGHIAKYMFKFAKAFDMNVIVHRRNPIPGEDKEMGFVYASDLNELLQKSDFVSLHVPITETTKGIVNKNNFLRHMKPNAILINTGRGALVNDDDLLAHLNENPEFYYGTDVLNGEPMARIAEFHSTLAKHPRVYCTPHIGGETLNADKRISDYTIEMIEKFQKTGKVDEKNCINQDFDLSDLRKLTIRYFDEKGVLTDIMRNLQDNGLHLISLDHSVFKSREACVMNIKYDGEFDKDKVINDLMTNKNVIDATF